MIVVFKYLKGLFMEFIMIYSSIMWQQKLSVSPLGKLIANLLQMLWTKYLSSPFPEITKLGWFCKSVVSGIGYVFFPVFSQLSHKVTASNYDGNFYLDKSSLLDFSWLWQLKVAFELSVSMNKPF